MRSFLSRLDSVSHESVSDLLVAYHGRSDLDGETLETFWKSWTSSREATKAALAALVKADLQRRFDRDERPRVAEYLDRFPELGENSDQVVSLVYEEFCLLQEAGEDPDSDEFYDGYHEWRDSLLSQISYHRNLTRSIANLTSPPSFPKIGDKFDRYRLDQLIGAGAVARVYLATEDDLETRKVVIKISASFGQEPGILARLDHRNIVPILTIARSDDGLRGLCMPYRSGKTLDSLTQAIKRGPLPRTSLEFWDRIQPERWLDASGKELLPTGWEGYPLEGTYPEAVAWVGLTLARALAYLHEQGVLHRDIKPANLLMAHREGPQVLDFNLAKDPTTPANVAVSMNGGTLPYMAPEHLLAFLEVSAWKSVGPRADIYSLGLVLHELLTGQPPELPDPDLSMPRSIQGLILARARRSKDIRQFNPVIPPSLEAILAKCLAFDATDRYSTASELAEDLECCLKRLPLKTAANTSKAERGSNWLYRNRTVAATLGCILLLTSAIYSFVPPASVADRSDFRRAVKLIDSPRPDERTRARGILESILIRYPNSTWASIYLSLALTDLGDSSKERVSSLMKSACNQPDAEAVLLDALKRQPSSALLLSNYGFLLSKAHREKEARTQLEASIAVDPGQFLALTILMSIERNFQNHDRAIAWCDRAIRVAVESQQPSSRIYSVRLAKLASLAALADRVLTQEGSPAERGQGADLLSEIEHELVLLNEDFRASSLGDGVSDHYFLVALYEGIIASGRGLLSAEALNKTAAKSLFDRAEREFDTALERLNKRPGTLASSKQRVAREREKLQMRRALIVNKIEKSRD